MSNSSLICYTKISPNRTSPRNHVIDTITIHCMAGNCTIETCANIFYPAARKASSNYGVGSDGRIGMYCEEKDRSWCTSSGANDHRAITIEVANDGDASTGWHVSDAAYNSLIKLVADICRRNGIKKLLWQADKSLIGHIDKQNMTVHRWFAAKSCPGDYLYNRHGQIASAVNTLLGVSVDPTPSNPVTIINKVPYIIRVMVDELNIRKGAGTSFAKTGSIKNRGAYTIVEEAGNWGRLKSGAGWICLDYTKKV